MDMSFPFISLMDICTPPGIVIRTPFIIAAGEAHDGITPDENEGNIVTGAIEGNPNASDGCFDLDMCTPCLRIQSRSPR